MKVVARLTIRYPLNLYLVNNVEFEGTDVNQTFC